jgi:hypothetical protein
VLFSRGGLVGLVVIRTRVIDPRTSRTTLKTPWGVWGAKISVLSQITGFSECAPSFGTPHPIETVHGLGNRKNELVLALLRRLREHGADVVVSDLAELLERP